MYRVPLSFDESSVAPAIPKPHDTNELILHAIEQSILFKNCGIEDLETLAEAFAPVHLDKGAQVITQNEEGDDFYVVEEGALRCFVLFPGEEKEAEVRTPYVRGESFGELALMYNNPRAATRLRAASDCKLWSIKRGAVRAILTNSREKVLSKRKELLSNVVVGDVPLGEKLSKGDLEQLSNALEDETFASGECIVREGETGDSFYVVQSGAISVHRRRTAAGGAPGSYFGELALMSDEARKATCVALGTTVCLSLGEILVEEELDTTDGNGLLGRELGVNCLLRITQLFCLPFAGKGAFGSVKLVLHKPTGKAFALKSQGKKAIVANELQVCTIAARQCGCKPIYLDSSYIYFVLEALMGGEIYTHLQKAGNFDETATKFYAATVVCAIQHMHERSIAYRDLKPENLVLDAQGYIKLVDLGLAKVVPTGCTWTICGTPDYLAPEIILNEGHDHAVDFWALGVLIYEMLAGVAPFYALDPMSTYENILACKVHTPISFSKSVKDIVRRLLKINKGKRLGGTSGGAASVMKHKWFSGFNWKGLLKKELEVPINPELDGPFDASNFTSPRAPDDEAEPCPEWEPDLGFEQGTRKPVSTSSGDYNDHCVNQAAKGWDGMVSELLAAPTTWPPLAILHGGCKLLSDLTMCRPPAVLHG
eukprot:jgi/Undpi1/8048/HiC_scaffold_24.g10520.m1